MSVDICQGGCGGIWFDSRELDNINQEKSTGHAVPGVYCDADSCVDEHRVRKCPRCEDVVLKRRLFSLGTGVVMDCCPGCHGIWLDHGELEKIREETNPARRPAVSRAQPFQRIEITFGLINEVRRHAVQQTA